MNIIKKMQLLALLPLLLTMSCDNDTTNPSAPEVLSTSPQDGSVDVATNTAVSISFSSEMDPLTISSTSFVLVDGIVPVVGTMSYNEMTVMFTPLDILKANTNYTGTLSGAKSTEGVAILADYTFSFTTGFATDITAPTISEISPLGDATDVARNKVISVKFSEKMIAETIDEASFFITQGTTVIAGSVDYANQMATLIPDEILDASLSYSVTVTTDVKDLAGNSLAAAKVWSFETGAEAGLAVVNLRSSDKYVVLAKTAINVIPTSAITGDLGLSPAATSFITGLALTDATGYATSAQVTGKIYAADMASPTSINLTTAVENMITAYNDAAGRPTPDFSELGTGNIGGKTLESGLYKWSSTVTIPSDLVISGSADDVWIFQIAGDLTMSSAVNITLEGGAQAKNIFWQVAGEVIIGTTSHFEGVVLCMTGITLQTGASMNGRAMSQTAVILDGNVVTQP